ncbi:20S proteasome subunit A/B [Haladaptatus salinisoli]|uniref:20S proteasome subunit A/B n=1 Tax=Haladaptatus salinisoli TaxID=2884876 RepID=UPI001D0AB331|nr:20S proteasome subunit A/B [Haladaptatus salinisoli]
MATVLGIATPEGAVLAGDRRETSGGSVESEAVRRVFDYDFAGAAVVGEVGGIQEFDRRFEAELRSHRVETDERMTVDRVARTASDIVEAVGVDALVVARDSEGEIHLREIGSDGRVLSTDAAALGSGASIAFGRLEGADTDEGLDAVEELARETLRVVAQRNPDTGTDIDAFRLERATDADAPS